VVDRKVAYSHNLADARDSSAAGSANSKIPAEERLVARTTSSHQRFTSNLRWSRGTGREEPDFDNVTDYCQDLRHDRFQSFARYSVILEPGDSPSFRTANSHWHLRMSANFSATFVQTRDGLGIGVDGEKPLPPIVAFKRRSKSGRVSDQCIFAFVVRSARQVRQVATRLASPSPLNEVQLLRSPAARTSVSFAGA
jgi:hypothetical protein